MKMVDFSVLDHPFFGFQRHFFHETLETYEKRLLLTLGEKIERCEACTLSDLEEVYPMHPVEPHIQMKVHDDRGERLINRVVEEEPDAFIEVSGVLEAEKIFIDTVLETVVAETVRVPDDLFSGAYSYLNTPYWYRNSVALSGAKLPLMRIIKSALVPKDKIILITKYDNTDAPAYFLQDHSNYLFIRNDLSRYIKVLALA